MTCSIQQVCRTRVLASKCPDPSTFARTSSELLLSQMLQLEKFDFVIVGGNDSHGAPSTIWTVRRSTPVSDSFVAIQCRSRWDRLTAPYVAKAGRPSRPVQRVGAQKIRVSQQQTISHQAGIPRICRLATPPRTSPARNNFRGLTIFNSTMYVPGRTCDPAHNYPARFPYIAGQRRGSER